MKPKPPASSGPLETELKLALPGSDPPRLAERLARVPVLARRKARRVQLHNVYYDTPDQVLRRQGVVLRLRRVADTSTARWLQTLKTGAEAGSSLSRRGEWEAPAPGAMLSMKAMDAAAWSRIDPQGAVFAALAPCFETSFERTLWLVRRRDGSAVEVALDIGHVAVGDKRAPICELELELKSGPLSALFEVAQRIAASVAVLPLPMGKAQRGYALASDAVDAPVLAAPLPLPSNLLLEEAARRVLREMFDQFTGNLNIVQKSEDPEAVHQARVGWRRFQSAVRLFRPVCAAAARPSWDPLRPMLAFLGGLRDLDVARTQALPPLEAAYVAGNAGRAALWEAMADTLRRATNEQRKAVRYALQDPQVGACLLAATRWIEVIAGPGEPHGHRQAPKSLLRQWARHRTAKLHARLERARTDNGSPASQHQVRILAKRTRYGIEALRSLLPRRISRQWYRQATDLQEEIGAARDLGQAVQLLERLGADRGLVDFLRGVGAGRENH